MQIRNIVLATILVIFLFSNNNSYPVGCKEIEGEAVRYLQHMLEGHMSWHCFCEKIYKLHAPVGHCTSSDAKNALKNLHELKDNTNIVTIGVTLHSFKNSLPHRLKAELDKHMRDLTSLKKNVDRAIKLPKNKCS